MTRRTFATELENAAETVASVSHADLRALLRRAETRTAWDSMQRRTNPSTYWLES
jgi:hypothetical protein